MTPPLVSLPGELQNDIRARLDAKSIKNLRATCSFFAKALPLHFDRVFISANSLNLRVFNAIANHETYRHQVTEVIWDDARLRTGPETAQEREMLEDEYGDDPEDECPHWFRKGRYDYHRSASYKYPKGLPHMGIEESWAHYQELVADQSQILHSNADIEAFTYGLRRFTSLRRITITPSTHGKHWNPLYKTPMIRAFPPGFDYALPKAWPSNNIDDFIDVLPWVSQTVDHPDYVYYGDGFTPEDYRNKWRGFRLVIRALVENDDGHRISELVIGGTEVKSGLNCKIFDEWSPEYDDLVTILKRPGFRHLDLHLSTGEMDDEDGWGSYTTGLLHDALAQAQDLEYLFLRTTTDLYKFVSNPEWRDFPLRNLFSPENWPRLRDFGISNMIVRLDDIINLLACMPPTLRSFEIRDVIFASSQHSYDDFLRSMRDALNWRSRPAEERPKVRMVFSSDEDEGRGEVGRYITLDEPVCSYLYGTGENPFEGLRSFIEKGQGGVRRDIFDPDLAAPF
ncbi:hypothetical protein FPOA_09330 [Fusarium poae]|uniref:F-box domain-containing protein n=1 Tax=Fusarium poae TaxID=36050 RepID=A0A1B8ARP5_FUSPO|nr:hypothetical protein FPOA_09330 [Fusarium poae]